MGKAAKAGNPTAGQIAEARRSRSRSAWAQRHPEIAAAERALRKERREARERFGHKPYGTVQTHAHVARSRTGALARLFQSGALSADELGIALEIAAVHERIGRDATIQTASFETRVDKSRVSDALFLERLGWVRREMAYSRWRARLPEICAGRGGTRIAPAAVLDLIAHDMGVTVVARRHRIHVRRARKLLCDALALWRGEFGTVCREVDDEALTIAHIGLH